MPPKDINTSAVAGQIKAAQQLKQTGDVTKAQIAANKQAAANQTTPELVPPTGDPSAVSAPVITNLRFEDLMRQRFEKEYAEEKRKEQERLQKERLGYGIAGLAATIGDMVRASEGAPINPRDWQQIYDNLTAQEKANVNNYNVRMAKLREDARNDRKAAAAAAAQAEAAKQQREFDYFKWKIEHDDKLSEAEKNRLAKYLEVLENNKTRKDVADIYQRGRESMYRSKLLASSDVLNYNGKVYYYPKGQFIQLANDIAGMLKGKYGESIKFLQNIDGFKSAKELEIALRNYLQNDEEIKNKPEMKKDIEDMLNSIAINHQYTVMREFDAASQAAGAGAATSTGGYTPPQSFMVQQ